MMKIKKRYAVLLLAMCLTILSGCIPVFADTAGFSEEYSRFQNPDGIMAEGDAEKLNEELDEISHRQNLDVTVVLVETFYGESVQAYADDLYDTCDYGYGDEKDGLLLLVSLKDRDWYISTFGYATTVFTDAGIQYIGEQIAPKLADGAYLEAFETYISQCDRFIAQAKKGKPYDTGAMPRNLLSPIWLPISILVGFGGALLIVGVYKGQLKSVRMQREAENYVREGSFQVTNRGDYFLYRHVSRTPKQQPKRSGGSGDGSSMHTSSSGRSHGGGGGKF